MWTDACVHFGTFKSLYSRRNKCYLVFTFDFIYYTFYIVANIDQWFELQRYKKYTNYGVNGD